jgi:ABC-type antimicrobial peptide transport system permease subunit
VDIKSKKAPKLAKALLKRLSPSHLEDTALGDYDEIFRLKMEQRGSFRAKLWYWQQALRSIPVSTFWGLVMLRNYLTVTWRNIKRHKAFSLINIAGLAIGIACCILILLWIQDELSWDRFHENAKNIYQVSQKQYDGHLTPVTPLPLADHLKTEFPEVVNATRYLMYYKLQLKYGDKSFSERPLIADPAFFQMLSFDFVKGDPNNAFTSLRSMVITEELALKLFGQEDPLGKSISGVDNRSDYTISGVIKNVPHNSTLQFDCVLPLELVAQRRRPDDWGSSYLWTYVQLQKNSSYQEFNKKIADIVNQRARQNKAELFLQPLTQLHLRPQGSGGPIIYVYIFTAMAVFVLIIACINFINLTTARSSNRAREVGLRKVIGARRENLVKQFFGDSFLFSLAAVMCALLLVALFLPIFNTLSGKQFTFGQNVVNNPGLILGIVGITLFTGILSGFYPALLLSSFQPVKVLRAAKIAPGSNRSPMLRRGLVVLQFSLSIFLMIGTFIIYQQLDFIKNRDLGFDKGFVVCSDSTWGNIDLQTIKQELQQNPKVESVTFTSQKMGEWESGAREDVKWEGRAPDLKITFEVIFCDHDYLDTHKMEMVQGRFFSRDFPSDERQAFILNETAVREMGFGGRSAVGESLSFWGDYNGTVIGVIKDFHTQSLHDHIQPVIMAYNPGLLDNVSIRINPEEMPDTLKFIQDKWRAMGGSRFEYFFLDESLDQRYSTEAATGSLLRYFTFLAILISCIGLLGLVSYIALQRTKEIGVRKVLGASVSSIIKLLAKEFVLLVVLANVIAWPLAYWVVKKWLENFAYRTDIGFLAFALSGGLALIIALLTVGLQSLKTATANPVESLRYE